MTMLKSLCNGRVVRFALAAGVLLATTACSNVEPWVKPYERDRLADPIKLLEH